jgi:hypothetical protein
MQLVRDWLKINVTAIVLAAAKISQIVITARKHNFSYVLHTVYFELHMAAHWQLTILLETWGPQQLGSGCPVPCLRNVSGGWRKIAENEGWEGQVGLVCVLGLDAKVGSGMVPSLMSAPLCPPCLEVKMPAPTCAPSVPVRVRTGKRSGSGVGETGPGNDLYPTPLPRPPQDPAL